jgi:hypothetical protein
MELTPAEKKLLHSIVAGGNIEREKRVALFIQYVVAPAGCIAILAWGYLAELFPWSIVPAIGLAGLIAAVGYSRLMHYRLYRIVQSLSGEKGAAPDR